MSLLGLIIITSNKFVIATGSYGGIYAPNIASVIHENNKAILAGQQFLDYSLINLETIMLSIEPYYCMFYDHPLSFILTGHHSRTPLLIINGF